MITISRQKSRTVPEQVAAHVKGIISRKSLKRGAPLPSYRELAAQLNVALFTAKRGVDILAEQGIVRRQVGQGCFVNCEVTPQGRPLKTIGIVHLASAKHLFSAPYLAQIMQGMNEAHESLDTHIFTMREKGFITQAQLADRHVDGVILLGVESETLLREFVSWGIPGVVADHFSPGIPLDFVACDNESGAQLAVQRVVEMGHRRIRYVGSEPYRTMLVGYDRDVPLETYSSDHVERQAAVARVLSACPGVRWDQILLPGGRSTQETSGARSIPEVAQTWMMEADRPTAFVVDNDITALNLIHALESEGVQVPRDVSVCSVAGAGVTPWGSARVAHSRFDFVEMGRKALKLLRLCCERPTEAADPAVY
ncbi:MAG: substrate-binding domain-containing protein, partial [bacterium]